MTTLDPIAPAGNIAEESPEAETAEGTGSDSDQEATLSSDSPEVTVKLMDLLEARFQTLADALRHLQQENGDLRETNRVQGERITTLEGTCNDLEQQAEGLRDERKRTIDRLESLLTRFDELEQTGQT